QQALGFVFWAGVIFLVLSVLGLRNRIAQAIPASLRSAGTVGIGLFIAYLGFRNMGLIHVDALGLSHVSAIHLPQLLSLLGLILMAYLQARKLGAPLLIGIAGITLASMALGLTPLPQRLFSLPPSITPLTGKLEILFPLTLSTMMVVLTFFYVAM